MTRDVDKLVHILHILNNQTFNLSVGILPKKSIKLFYISTSKNEENINECCASKSGRIQFFRKHTATRTHNSATAYPQSFNHFDVINNNLYNKKKLKKFNEIITIFGHIHRLQNSTVLQILFSTRETYIYIAGGFGLVILAHNYGSLLP